MWAAEEVVFADLFWCTKLDLCARAVTYFLCNFQISLGYFRQNYQSVCLSIISTAFPSLLHQNFIILKEPS